MKMVCYEIIPILGDSASNVEKISNWQHRFAVRSHEPLTQNVSKLYTQRNRTQYSSQDKFG